MFVVYIIKSGIKNFYYVGSTSDIRRRIVEHNSGKTKSTKAFIPFQLVYKKEFDSETEARQYERKLKQQRRLKENIIKSLSK